MNITDLNMDILLLACKYPDKLDELINYYGENNNQISGLFFELLTNLKKHNYTNYLKTLSKLKELTQ